MTQLLLQLHLVLYYPCVTLPQIPKSPIYFKRYPGITKHFQGSVM